MLLQQIKDDLLVARKSRNAQHSTFLITLFAECERVGLDDGKRLSTDAEVTQVLTKFVKNAKEVHKLLTENGTVELDSDAVKQINTEMELTNKYLPKVLTREELEDKIGAIIITGGYSSMKDMGAVMKELRATGSNYDGGIASSLVKSALSN